MKKTLAIIGVAALLATVLVTSGCAHARDGSKTFHTINAYGAAVPPGWTVVKPDITNTPSGNQVTDFSVIAPSGTNTSGFWSGLVNRPKTFLAYRETWEDKSSGGGTFVFTDPQASQLSFTKTNQSGLGGSRSVTIGSIQSTITTNAVAAITSAGSAVGNVIGAAAKAASGTP
jgi:hypothetical protein